MAIDTRRLYAVLTGDIVKSTSLSPRELETVRATLDRAVRQVRRWERGLVAGGPEFFRGDAWQLLLSGPGPALRVAVFLRASLRAAGLADTRIAIGIGAVDGRSGRRVSLSGGEAFVLSGKALDGMTRYAKLAIEAPLGLGPLADWLRVASHLCDALIEQWTVRQAQFVRAAVHSGEPTMEEIRRSVRPPVSKQSIAKSLAAANWHAVREAVRLFERTPWELLPHADAPVNRKRLTGARQPKTVVLAKTTKKS